MLGKVDDVICYWQELLKTMRMYFRPHFADFFCYIFRKEVKGSVSAWLLLSWLEKWKWCYLTKWRELDILAGEP